MANDRNEFEILKSSVFLKKKKNSFTGEKLTQR